MAIIISKDGKNAKRINKSEIEKEDYLQKYIYENPESIPLYEIKEDIHLLILSREFQTKSGPIDAIGIDKDGEIYLVETKLYKNPDKRLVVAQVLDYGASLWRSFGSFDDFTRIIDDEVNKTFGVSFNQKIKEFFGLEDEEVSALIDNLKKNLNAGNFKFVVLMDKLHSQLKDLIVFINENSQFDIFAVELEFYKHEEYEIIIPKLFGAEVKKDVSVSSASIRKEWNEENFFVAVKQTLKSEDAKMMKIIYDDFKKISDRIRWGTGTQLASYAPIIERVDPAKSLLSIHSNGKLTIKFNWFAHNERQKSIRDKLKKSLENYLKIPPNYRDLMATFELKEWLPHAKEVIKAFGELKK